MCVSVSLVVKAEECYRNQITQCQEMHWEVLKGCLRVGTRERDRGREGETRRNGERQSERVARDGGNLLNGSHVAFGG